MQREYREQQNGPSRFRGPQFGNSRYDGPMHDGPMTYEERHQYGLPGSDFPSFKDQGWSGVGTEPMRRENFNGRFHGDRGPPFRGGFGSQGHRGRGRGRRGGFQGTFNHNFHESDRQPWQQHPQGYQFEGSHHNQAWQHDDQLGVQDSYADESQDQAPFMPPGFGFGSQDQEQTDHMQGAAHPELHQEQSQSKQQQQSLPAAGAPPIANLSDFGKRPAPGPPVNAQGSPSVPERRRDRGRTGFDVRPAEEYASRWRSRSRSRSRERRQEGDKRSGSRDRQHPDSSRDKDRSLGAARQVLDKRRDGDDRAKDRKSSGSSKRTSASQVKDDVTAENPKSAGASQVEGQPAATAPAVPMERLPQNAQHRTSAPSSQQQSPHAGNHPHGPADAQQPQDVIRSAPGGGASHALSQQQAAAGHEPVDVVQGQQPALAHRLSSTQNRTIAYVPVPAAPAPAAGMTATEPAVAPVANLAEAATTTSSEDDSETGRQQAQCLARLEQLKQAYPELGQALANMQSESGPVSLTALRDALSTLPPDQVQAIGEHLMSNPLTLPESSYSEHNQALQQRPSVSQPEPAATAHAQQQQTSHPAPLVKAEPQADECAAGATGVATQHLQGTGVTGASDEAACSPTTQGLNEQQVSHKQQHRELCHQHHHQVTPSTTHVKQEPGQELNNSNPGTTSQAQEHTVIAPSPFEHATDAAKQAYQHTHDEHTAGTAAQTAVQLHDDQGTGMNLVQEEHSKGSDGASTLPAGKASVAVAAPHLAAAATDANTEGSAAATTCMPVPSGMPFIPASTSGLPCPPNFSREFKVFCQYRDGPPVHAVWTDAWACVLSEHANEQVQASFVLCNECYQPSSCPPVCITASQLVKKAGYTTNTSWRKCIVLGEQLIMDGEAKLGAGATVQQVLAIGVEHLQQQLQLQQSGLIMPLHAPSTGNALEGPGEQTSSLQLDTMHHTNVTPAAASGGLQQACKADMLGAATTLSSENPAQPSSLTGAGSMFSPNSPPTEYAREYKVMVSNGSMTQYGLLINLWQLVQGKASKAVYNSKIMVTDETFQVTQPRTVLAGAAFCRKVGKDNGHWPKLVMLAEAVHGLAVGEKVLHLIDHGLSYLSKFTGGSAAVRADSAATDVMETAATTATTTATGKAALPAALIPRTAAAAPQPNTNTKAAPSSVEPTTTAPATIKKEPLIPNKTAATASNADTDDDDDQLIIVRRRPPGSTQLPSSKPLESSNSSSSSSDEDEDKPLSVYAAGTASKTVLRFSSGQVGVDVSKASAAARMGNSSSQLKFDGGASPAAVAAAGNAADLPQGVADVKGRGIGHSGSSNGRRSLLDGVAKSGLSLAHAPDHPGHGMDGVDIKKSPRADTTGPLQASGSGKVASGRTAADHRTPLSRSPSLNQEGMMQATAASMQHASHQAGNSVPAAGNTGNTPPAITVPTKATKITKTGNAQRPGGNAAGNDLRSFKPPTAPNSIINNNNANNGSAGKKQDKATIHSNGGGVAGNAAGGPLSRQQGAVKQQQQQAKDASETAAPSQAKAAGVVKKAGGVEKSAINRAAAQATAVGIKRSSSGVADHPSPSSKRSKAAGTGGASNAASADKDVRGPKATSKTDAGAGKKSQLSASAATDKMLAKAAKQAQAKESLKKQGGRSAMLATATNIDAFEADVAEARKELLSERPEIDPAALAKARAKPQRQAAGNQKQQQDAHQQDAPQAMDVDQPHTNKTPSSAAAAPGRTTQGTSLPPSTPSPSTSLINAHQLPLQQPQQQQPSMEIVVRQPSPGPSPFVHAETVHQVMLSDPSIVNAGQGVAADTKARSSSQLGNIAGSLQINTTFPIVPHSSLPSQPPGVGVLTPTNTLGMTPSMSTADLVGNAAAAGNAPLVITPEQLAAAKLPTLPVGKDADSIHAVCSQHLMPAMSKFMGTVGCSSQMRKVLWARYSEIKARDDEAKKKGLINLIDEYNMLISAVGSGDPEWVAEVIQDMCTAK